jgi:phospholipase/lecithinase/hemolysin
MKDSISKRKIPGYAFCVRALGVLTAALSIWAAQVPAWACGHETPFTRIIVFGDSVSDTGNFYQMTGGSYPPAPYWEGRFCNGPVWVEYLAQDLRMEGLLDDYAVGGATSGHDNANVPTFGGVQDQIALYLQSSTHADPDALYILWAGHNDIFIPLSTGGDMDAARIAFVENTKSNIKTLWAAGARHILVPNVVDVGKCPMLVSTPYSAYVSGVVAAFNEDLADALKRLARKGVTTIAVDEFSFVDFVVAHPALFGFSNVTDQGIAIYPADPAAYVYWDIAHPTTRAQQLMEKVALWRLIESYPHMCDHGEPCHQERHPQHTLP